MVSKRPRQPRLHRSGKGYVTGKVCHVKKCLPVHITCAGKISFTKQGKKTWSAMRKASKTKTAAKLKAHRVSRVHHRKSTTRRKKPCGCGA